jgi:hypothetical protein
LHKGPRWSREQIRAARLAALSPLLQQRGLQIVEQEAGNFILPAYPGLIVKASYWRWPERNLAGNAIDFHVQVLGLSFHDATRQITGTRKIHYRNDWHRQLTTPVRQSQDAHLKNEKTPTVSQRYDHNAVFGWKCGWQLGKSPQIAMTPVPQIL